MLIRDAEVASQIDGDAFSIDYEAMVADKDIMPFIYDVNGQPGAVLIAGRHPEWVDLIHIAVAPNCRRLGLGKMIVNNIRGRLGFRKSILTKVPERNLEAQMFFKSCGFTWYRTLPNWYGQNEDCYLMRTERERGLSLCGEVCGAARS
jgi:ribosomal protein S18 acetylase RimI-like enzyme